MRIKLDIEESFSLPAKKPKFLALPLYCRLCEGPGGRWRIIHTGDDRLLSITYYNKESPTFLDTLPHGLRQQPKDQFEVVKKSHYEPWKVFLHYWEKPHLQQDTLLLKLGLIGTEFQLKVWKELAKIPYGQWTSYSELGERAGVTAKACRAVGGAVGANPIGLILPCHRVLTRQQTIGGFAWGIELKKVLLQTEGITY